MALDWKKEVSLSSITSLFKRGKGSTGGSSKYPSKTTMNLYQVESKTTDIRKVILVGVLLAVLIGVFVKFGVFDQLALLSQKEGELAQQQALASTTASALKDYDEVKEKYDSFIARYGTESADAIAVLDMVEQRVKSRTTVTSIVLSDNVLTLTLYNVPLDTVGELSKDLEQQSMVKSVNVTAASTENGETTLVIALAGNSEEEK